MDWTEDLLWEIESAGDEQSLLLCLQRAAQMLGFEYCAYGIQLPVPFTRPQVILLNSYPEPWRERYQEAGYLEVDPTVERGRQTEQSFIWSDALFTATPQLWSEARAAGLRVGWAKSIVEGQGVAGMLSLARGSEAVSQAEREDKEAMLKWLASAVHHALRRMLMRRGAAPLTARERDVLRWAADGKTIPETAQILHLSIATVKFHTYNAVAKLGVVNRTAAVARAVALGLLT